MTSVARAAWHLPRAPHAPPRAWWDWVLVGVLAALAVLEAVLRQVPPAVWPSVAVELIVIATLLWRRAHPGAVVLIAFGAVLVADAVQWFIPSPSIELYTMAALLILPYTLVRWGSGKEIVVVGAIMLIAMARSLFTGPPVLQNIIGGIAVVAASLSLGAVFRYRAAVRTERLERAHSQERERLARDLHDTVAHHVSAIAISAQAGLTVADRDRQATADMLRVIESEARRTLREMRSVVGTLRDDTTGGHAPDGDLSPAPGVADLRGLADRDDPPGGNGPPVSLRVDGDLDRLPAPVVTALYRIAQESITNARRHAVRATIIDAELTVEPDGVRLRVHDDGDRARPGTAQDVVPAGARGFGIVGMAERATALGGTCAAGPDPSGGWTVSVWLPTKGAGR
ncbi:MAG: sensor histidine kinase [Humibacter sp.]